MLTGTVCVTLLSVTVLLSTLELLRFPEASPISDPRVSYNEQFLHFRSLVYCSGSISCLRHFVKGFSDQFFVIRKSRFSLLPPQLNR
jgi:hypothetical protein